MSERSRQRWLHVKNRLEELGAKYGPLADEPLPEWLDSIEGYMAANPAQDAPEPAPSPEPVQPDTEQEAPQNRASEPSEGKPPRTADW